MAMQKYALILALLLGSISTLANPVHAAYEAPDNGTGTYSANWAGYVALDGRYTDVGGTWVVPTPDSARAPDLSTDAVWVGIGGKTSPDLIQAGTQAIYQNGRMDYQAWYELLPDDQRLIPVAVQGGDKVTTTITQIAPGLWRIAFINLTTDQSYSTDVNYRSSLSSAEWVVERPVLETTTGTGYGPLDRFGSVTFTNGFTMDNGIPETIESSGATKLAMATRAETFATPGDLANDSFTVARASTAPSGETIAAPSSYPTGYVITRRVYRHGHRYVIQFSIR